MYADWQSHTALVRRAARRYARTIASVDDLYAVGLVGLWEAAQRHDPDRGDFERFAKPRVRGAVKDYLRAIFGRKGKYHRPASLDVPDPPDVPHHDQGLRTVDAKDELAHLAKGPPIECPGRGPDNARMVFWRGRVQSMSEWGAELGFSNMTLRVKQVGLELAFTAAKQ